MTEGESFQQGHVSSATSLPTGCASSPCTVRHARGAGSVLSGNGRARARGLAPAQPRALMPRSRCPRIPSTSTVLVASSMEYWRCIRVTVSRWSTRGARGGSGLDARSTGSPPGSRLSGAARSPLFDASDFVRLEVGVRRARFWPPSAHTESRSSSTRLRNPTDHARRCSRAARSRRAPRAVAREEPAPRRSPGAPEQRAHHNRPLLQFLIVVLWPSRLEDRPCPLAARGPHLRRREQTPPPVNARFAP